MSRPHLATTMARLLLLALMALLVAHTPQAQAQAAGSIRYFSTQDGRLPTYTPQYLQEMSLSLLLEARAADGRVLCSPCLVVPAGAATYSVTVEGWNAQRYEVISETCKGVRSTVPQLQCINGPLELSVRVHTGEVDLRTAYLPGTSTTPYGAWVNGPRLVFLENPSKYWDNVVPNGKVPAGKYKIANGNQTGVLPRGGGIVGCNKTHVNTEDVLDVPAGGSVIHTMVFRIDDCPVRVEVDFSTTGTPDYEIQGATLTCRRAFTSLDYCEGWIQHGTELTITARVPAGFQPRFRGPIGCSAVNACLFRVQTHEVVRMSIVPSVAPPPPTPSLSVSLGDAPPLSRTEAKGRSNLPWLQARLTPADGTVEVTALTLQARGTGRDDLDLTELRVHADSNANGRVDAGEPLLGRGRYATDDGNLTISFASPLAVAAPTHLLVVGDVADTVNTAAAVGFGGTALAMLALAAWPGARRRRTRDDKDAGEPALPPGPSRRRGHLAGALLGLLLLAACGGGDSAEPTTPSSLAPLPAPPVTPPVAPPVTPPPPSLPPVTYEIRLTAIQARSAASPATAVTASGLPIPGATISAQP
jgi:hypothetical protein